MDWFGNANLQKSNADTLTDILTNDAGAIFGTLFAFWLYRHATDEHERKECGEIADWLMDRLVRLFTNHGVLVGIVVALAIAAIIAAGWLMDRGPVPPPPSTQGTPQTWTFGPDPGASTATATLLGEWQPDDRGIC